MHVFLLRIILAKLNLMLQMFLVELLRSLKKRKQLKMRDTIPASMRSTYTVQAFPLYSLLMATGIKHVDFLSLDVEGAELDILNTIPWDKVDIDLVMVEVE